MTFLVPALLWALPLCLIPLLIHLFNRLRYRNVKWAAMIFLLRANRSSTSMAKLRQFLILFFRIMALLVFIMIFTRPVWKGWGSSWFSGPPGTIVILLDRSASMESLNAGDVSQRENALKKLTGALKQFEGNPRLVLIDSFSLKPKELIDPEMLSVIPETRATSSAADIPALCRAACDYLIENRIGSAELWLVSDLQESNWEPQSDTWKYLEADFKKLPASVRFRILGVGRENENNYSVRVKNVYRNVDKDGRKKYYIAVEVSGSGVKKSEIPVKFFYNGFNRDERIKLSGQTVRFVHEFEADENKKNWGYVELPADDNPADNRAYWVYDSKIKLEAAIVSESDEIGRVLKFATVPIADNSKTVSVYSARELAKKQLSDFNLLIWQGAMPSGDLQKRLEAYLEAGGILFCLPSMKQTASSGTSLEGVSWGALSGNPEKTFRIVDWDHDFGILANSVSGEPLDLENLKVYKRVFLTGKSEACASYADGQPFLAFVGKSKGKAYFCTTLPSPDWSNLGDGSVLVPMIQRMLEEGSRRNSRCLAVDCGVLLKETKGANALASKVKDPVCGRDSGIFQTADSLIAFNRPVREDYQGSIDISAVKKLFGKVPVYAFKEINGNDDVDLQVGIWKQLAGLVLLLLISEALLCTPGAFSRREDR
jgi:hypothetical protein